MERNRLICGEALAALRKIPVAAAQLVIADLPYFQVLERTWDRQRQDADGYIKWSLAWLDEAMRVVQPDGLLIASASWASANIPFSISCPKPCAAGNFMV